MGSPCLFTRQQALKLGYFYLLRIKNSNPFLTELRTDVSKYRPEVCKSEKSKILKKNSQSSTR